MNRIRVKVEDGLFAKGIITGTKYNLHFSADILGDPCVYCGGPSNSWEHVRPLSWNEQPFPHYQKVRACQNCNGRRGSKPLLHYLLERRQDHD